MPVGNNYHRGYREGVKRKFYKAPGSVAGIHLIFQNYQLLPPFRIFSLTAYQYEDRVWEAFKCTGLRSASLGFDSVLSPPCWVILGSYSTSLGLSLSVKIGIIIVASSYSPWENSIICGKSWHVITTNKWLTRRAWVKRASLGKKDFDIYWPYMMRKTGTITLNKIQLCRVSSEDMGRPPQFLSHLWIDSKSRFFPFPEPAPPPSPPTHFALGRERFFKAAQSPFCPRFGVRVRKGTVEKSCFTYISRDKEEMFLHRKWN